MSSGNINTVSIKADLYAEWMFSGYVNTVPKNLNPYAQWLSLTVFAQWHYGP